MWPKSDWQHLIPHAGGMCLLDAVLAFDDTCIHASSASHRDVRNPLRRDGALDGVHLAEYGAQAMAVHGALLARADGNAMPRPGLLVALRKVSLQAERVDTLPGTIDIHAERLLADSHGAQYRFHVEHEGRVLCSGRAAVIHPAGDDA